MDDQRKPDAEAVTVAVLAGGASAEREVSLNSGAAVTAALRAGGHRVIEIDPACLDLRRVDWTAVVDERQPEGQPCKIDVVFIALHGAFGEDGQVQRILDEAGVPYTGSGAHASQLAFSKSAAKEQFRHEGVPTPDFELIRPADDPARWYAAAERIGYPVVVKPDQQGSSIGVTIVRTSSHLVAAIDECFRHDQVGLIERAIPGEEWTVGLLDDLLLPAIQIETPREFYDYAAKYQTESTRYEFDSSSAPHRFVSDVARQAARAIGTRGLARVDLRVDSQGQPWVLEVNTIPGMTDHSLVPKAAARMGLDMRLLCQRAIASALRNQQDPQNKHAPSERYASLAWRRAG